MNFEELVRKRRACHHFAPDRTVPREDLLKMVEIASLSPSGYNAQPWEFVMITEPDNRRAVAEIAFGQSHLKDASAMIVILADLEIGRHVDRLLQDWLKHGYCTADELPAYRNSIAKNRSPEKRKLMGVRNAMLAAMTLIYAAEDMGYATCPVMGLSQRQLEAHLRIPEDRVLALLVAIGFSEKNESGEALENPRLPRKSLDELVHWERFGAR